MEVEEESTPSADAREVYARHLTASARLGSAAWVTWTNWVLSGFGAVIGLLFANMDRLQSLVRPSGIKCAAAIFLVALVLGLSERAVAAWVQAAAGSAEEFWRIQDERRKQGQPLEISDADNVWLTFEFHALPVGAFRWPAEHIRRAMKGAAGYGPARLVYRTAQRQAHIGLFATLLCIASGAVLVMAALV